MKITTPIIGAAALLCLTALPTFAVNADVARQACIRDIATKHNALMGNVHITGTKKHSSGYAITASVNDANVNCIVNGKGKVTYSN